MTRQKLRSLRFWLPLLLAAFAGGGSAILYLVEYKIRTAEFESAFQQDQLFHTAQLQNEVERGVQRNDPEMVQTAFAGMGVMTALKGAWFLDASNVVMAANQRQFIGTPLDAAKLGLSPADEARLWDTVKMVRQQRVGRCAFTADRRRLLVGFPSAAPLHPGELVAPPGGVILANYELAAGKTASLRYLRHEFVFYLAGALLTALALGLGLHFLVTRRLERLEAGMGEFAAGQLSRPMRSALGDEISHLFDRFNEMASVIHREINDRRRVEESLRRANEYNRSLIEASLDPLVTISAEGKITDVNAATETATGCSRTELIGADFSVYFTEPERARAGYQRVFDQGAVWDYPLELRHRDGRVTPVLYNASVYRDENGRTLGVFAAARDITQRKRAEEAIKASVAQWQATFDAVHDLVMVLDRDYRIIRANKAVEKFLGLRPDQFLGQPCYRLIHGTDAPHAQCPFAGLCHSRTHAETELLTRENGVWVSVSVDPLFDDQGEITQVVHIVKDITERKQAEETLRRLNRELRAISNCNQILIRATDELTLLRDICRVVCEETSYLMAWVGYAENDAAKSVRPVAWAGAEEGYLKNLNVVWSDTERGRGPTGTAIRTGKSVFVQDFEAEHSVGPWREEALRRGFRSSTSVPLRGENDAVLGAFTIYSGTPNAFTTEEVRLLEELGGNLAFGITVLRDRLERKHAEEVVRQLNAELERRVAERTRELKLRTAELETIFETVPVGLCISYDADGRHIRGNLALERLAGISHGGELSLAADRRPAYRACRNGLDIPLSQLPIQRACRGAAVSDDVVEIVRDDGHVSMVQCSAAPLLDDDGRPRGAVGAFMDVTESKRVEEALRESEERFRTIYDTAPVSIWQEDWSEVIAMIREVRAGGVTDFALWFPEHPDFIARALAAVKILDVNQWTVDMFKARDKADLLASLGTVFATPETLPGFIAELAALAQGRPVFRTDMALNTVTGEQIHGLLVMSFPPLEATSGRVLVSVVDITDLKAAEMALRRQAAIIDLSPDAIIVRKLDGTILSWSRGAEAIYGWTSEEACGRQTHALLQTLFSQPLEQINAQIAEKGRWTGELVHRTKDERTVIVQSWWLAQFDEQGRLVELFESNIDITDRKRAEEALRASEERMRLFFERQLVGTAITSPQKGWVQVNDKLCEMLGYSRDELMRLTWAEITHPDDLAADEAQFDRLLKGEIEGYALEKRFVRKDGNIVFTYLSIGCVRHADRSVDYVLALLEDISKRKRVEEQISQLNAQLQQRAAELEAINRELSKEINVRKQAEGALDEKVAELESINQTLAETNRRLDEGQAALDQERGRYQELFDFAPDGYVVTDLRGKIHEVNLAACEMLGEERVFWRRFPLLRCFATPEQRRAVLALLNRFKQGRAASTERFEAAVCFGQRSAVACAVTVNAMADADGRLTGLRWLLRDITERQRIEENIQQLNVELQQRATSLEAANKELEAFCYSVSHDLRAPLRAIDGFSRILLEQYHAKLDDDGRDNLERVCAASQRMGHLIDDLLALSRVTRSEMHRRPVPLSDIAGQVAGELQHTEPDRTVEFCIQPALVAEGDPVLLRAVLENLLGNAWKFTAKQPAARIEFGVTSRHGAPAFFVRDNGAGFDMAYAGKLFGAFQRLHAVTDFPGTGIGLATVQRIIHRHGGEVAAEGAVGHGATFYFTLPPPEKGHDTQRFFKSDRPASPLVTASPDLT